MIQYETRCCAACGKVVGVVPQGTTVFCSGKCYEKWRNIQSKHAISLFAKKRRKRKIIKKPIIITSISERKEV